MLSAKQHVARGPSQKSGDADIAAFVDWLAAEMERSIAETEAPIRSPRRHLLRQSTV